MNKTLLTFLIKKSINDAIQDLYPDISGEIKYLDIIQFIPKEQREFGIYKTTVAFIVAKKKSISPVEVANQIVSKVIDLNKEGLGFNLKSAGGYINISVSDSSLLADLISMLESEQATRIKDKIDTLNVGDEDKTNNEVMIEFGQPNTHKAFHVGHLKSAITGESLARLFQYISKKVVRVNYFGDVGMHVAKCTWGFIQKGEPSGFSSWHPHKRMQYIDECYVFGAKEFKENIKSEQEIREINKLIYKGENCFELEVYKKLRDYSLEHQKLVWEVLNINFDKSYPESEVYKDAIAIVDKYKDKIFKKSDGAWIFEGEKIKKDLKTWVFQTGEGNPTYSAKDLGLAVRKFDEFPNLTKGYITTSVEQKDYFKAVIKVLELIDEKFNGKYIHIPFGWMLRESGQKFSSRMGDTVKGMDILNEVFAEAKKRISESKGYAEEEKEEIAKNVGLAGLKFLILSHKLHEDFNYNPDQFLSLKGFSGPYILYTLVRAKSIINNSNAQVTDIITSLQISEKERDLLIELVKFQTVIEDAAITREPYKICQTLYSISKLYNDFYDSHPVLQAESPQIKAFRLGLCKLTALYLEDGLYFLGIDSIERM